MTSNRREDVPECCPEHGRFGRIRHVTWKFNGRCNLYCPYCASIDNIPDPDYSMASAQKLWKNVYDRWGAVKVSCSGGEPTTRMDTICMLQDMGHVTAFSTNLVAPIDRYERLDPEQGQFAVSFHPLAWDMQVAPFAEKMNVLREAGYRTDSCSIVAWPPFMDHLHEWTAELDVHNIDVTLHPFRGTYGGRDYPDAYTSREHDVITDVQDGERTTRKLDGDMPDVDLCATGACYLFVEFDGSYYRCQWSEVELGNVWQDLNIEFADEPSGCPHPELCRCVVNWKYQIGG